MLGMASSIPCCAAISRRPTDERNKSQTSQSLFTQQLDFCDFTKSSLKLPKPPKRHFCLCYSPARTVRSASTMFESATNRATYLYRGRQRQIARSWRPRPGKRTASKPSLSDRSPVSSIHTHTHKRDESVVVE
eukprot:scaffold85558_cov28-Attheya_sp.AAC.1